MRTALFVLALAVGASATSLAQSCPDGCYFIYGYGWMCGQGTAGYGCQSANGNCSYYNCNQTEEEEDAALRATPRASTSVMGLTVAGQFLVAIDGCLGRRPLVLSIAQRNVEIALPRRGEGGL